MVKETALLNDFFVDDDNGSHHITGRAQCSKNEKNTTWRCDDGNKKLIDRQEKDVPTKTNQTNLAQEKKRLD